MAVNISGNTGMGELSDNNLLGLATSMSWQTTWLAGKADAAIAMGNKKTARAALLQKAFVETCLNNVVQEAVKRNLQWAVDMVAAIANGSLVG